MKTKKWSNPKGKKTQTVKRHVRSGAVVYDAWGRYDYTNTITIEEYKRRKPKKR